MVHDGRQLVTVKLLLTTPCPPLFDRVLGFHNLKLLNVTSTNTALKNTWLDGSQFLPAILIRPSNDHQGLQ
jgi:hypothetical protein